MGNCSEITGEREIVVSCCWAVRRQYDTQTQTETHTHSHVSLEEARQHISYGYYVGVANRNGLVVGDADKLVEFVEAEWCADNKNREQFSYMWLAKWIN